MPAEEMRVWLGAVEYLMTSSEGCYVENDFGDRVRVRSMTGITRSCYEKTDRSGEFCGVTDWAFEAILWLYENNKSDDEF